jgi:nitrite reductase (NO-forming)
VAARRRRSRRPDTPSQFSFKALNPGLYVYHCATAPVGMHIANGMYGLILVEPKEGLPKVDREYYVMQGDFYTRARLTASPACSRSTWRRPSTSAPLRRVQRLGRLARRRQRAQAKVGETVRLFVGNGGPNLTSSFHVIGEIFDRVYTEGGTEARAGKRADHAGARRRRAIVDFKVDVPGTYVIVDHSIFRTFNKGALGMLKDRVTRRSRRPEERTLAVS